MLHNQVDGDWESRVMHARKEGYSSLEQLKAYRFEINIAKLQGEHKLCRIFLPMFSAPLGIMTSAYFLVCGKSQIAVKSIITMADV